MRALETLCTAILLACTAAIFAIALLAEDTDASMIEAITGPRATETP